MMMLIYIACGSNLDTEEMETAMPIEIVSCTHPDSRFEAAVHVEIEDNTEWENVDFWLTQDENSWEASLQTNDHLVWWTHMQLYELDCLNKFEFGIEYESR